MARRVTELETNAIHAATAFLATDVVPLPDTAAGAVGEIVSWALAGNPSRRIRKNPWCPRTHH